jgi:DNA-binding IclR family transcriptional regulator
MGNDGVTAVERALSILDCFKIGSEKLTLAELSAALPLHKTTIFRLLNSLCRFGYIVRAADGSYTLGPRVLYLARVYESGFQLADIITPALRKLSEQTGESAAYYIASGDNGDRLCLFRHQPAQGLHSQVIAGSVMPPDNSSTGLVFKMWAQGPFKPPATLPFFSCGVRDPYTSSWSVPVIGGDDLFIGALTLAGPSARIKHADKAFIEKAIMESAWQLSSDLGASVDLREVMYRSNGHFRKSGK